MKRRCLAIIPALLCALTTIGAQQNPPSFAVIEGIFHDGLGTFAELKLANQLIELAAIDQSPFDLTASESKMREAAERLPANHPARKRFETEKANIAAATERGAAALLSRTDKTSLVRVHHSAKDFSDAKAADLVLEFKRGLQWPISVKTEKSNKIAVAESFKRFVSHPCHDLHVYDNVRRIGDFNTKLRDR